MEGSVAGCDACWLLRQSPGGSSQMRLLVVLVIPGRPEAVLLSLVPRAGDRIFGSISACGGRSARWAEAHGEASGRKASFGIPAQIVKTGNILQTGYRCAIETGG